MFDVIAGTDRTASPRRLLPLAVSLTAHALLTLAVVVPALYVMDQLPEVPTVMAFVAPVPAPPPPPPPPPPAPAKAEKARPATASAPNAAPIEAPPQIKPETGFERVETGVVGGVEGGIPGGIVGGIVGGISNAPPPPPPPPVAPRRPVRVGGEIAQPTQLVRVAPVYPEIAARALIQGMVIIEATVDETGHVREAKVLRSVKFLDDAAIAAVKQWQYSPLLLNGEPMPFVLTVMVSFKVDSEAR